MILRRSWRIPQRRTVPTNGCEYGLWVGIEQIGDERVGMPRGERVGSQIFGREVPQISSHDYVRLSVDRRGQHMGVAGIG